MKTKDFQQFLNSYSVKMVFIMVLALVLLVPSFLIRDLVQERIQLGEKVKKELYVQWGEKQVIAGPVLNVPFSVSSQKESEEEKGIAHLLPESLKARIEIVPEVRKRGIYKAVVYKAALHLTGSFAGSENEPIFPENAKIQWDASYFTLGISALRGVRDMPEAVFNGQPGMMSPGMADTDLFDSGITIRTDSTDVTQPIIFSIDLVLDGSESIWVEALGKVTEVSMQSAWARPAFTGGFLPNQRQVSQKGFSAAWKVTHLNRNFPQQWLGKKYSTHDATLGVELLLPVNHYQKSLRSIKYAFLFIVVQFMVFLFIEIKSKIRIHPFQYSLVALALLIFYSLLISIGEHIGFNPAYAISAVSVTCIVGWYAYSVLQDKRRAGQIVLLQSGLYLFLFFILQLQDFALLAGSLGLLMLLILIMWASQKIDWYEEE